MTKTAIPDQMRQWILARRPNGLAVSDDFEINTVPVPIPDTGEVLVKTQFLGVAPVMLRYMNNETDFERDLDIGDVMHGRGVGKVVASNHPDWAVDDLVCARLRWREYATFNGDDDYFMPFRLRHPDLPASLAIGSLGYNGYTAITGLQTIGTLKPGDDVLVSGAAGGVGCNVAFVAKAMAAKRVIGIAGGPEKCQLLTETLGYDAAIDYQSDDVESAIDEFLPDGVDVFFDNVGGELLDWVMARINRRARIVLCGRISQYLQDPEDYHRPKNFYRLALKDAKAEGFFIFDYQHLFEAQQDKLAEWIHSGELVPHEDLLEGLESMPDALIGLYTGTNSGVRVVRIDPDAKTL